MDDRDFRSWFEHHAAAFPSLHDWFNKQTDETQGHWRRALDDVSKSEAEKATDAIFSGDVDDPQGYTNHPRAIRAAVAQFREQDFPLYVDGEQARRCADCRDTGTVVIFSNQAHAYYRSGGAEQSTLKPGDDMATAAVACDCVAGERFENPKPYPSGRKPRKLRRLVRSHDVISTGDWPADLAAMAAKYPSEPPKTADEELAEMAQDDKFGSQNEF